MALSKKAVEILAKKHQIPLDQLLKIMDAEVNTLPDSNELLFVPFRIGTTMYRSMNHASRFFREIRDNGMFYAATCPKCSHTLFPPQRPVCLACIKRGILSEYEYVKLGPEIQGMCSSWSQLVRGTSKQGELFKTYPSYVKVDGCDNSHWQFVYLANGKDIRIGARVRSVLRPQEERTGEISDYWFLLE